MQSTEGFLNKPVQQQQHFPSTVNLIPANASGVTIANCNQQQFGPSPNTGNSNLISVVSNVNNESKNISVIGVPVASGVRTQNTAISASGSNSASGVVVSKLPVSTVGVFSCNSSVSNINAGLGNIYVQTASSGVTGTRGVGAGGTVGAVHVSPTARKRIKLENPIIEVEHDISALKKLILEHKYMRLRCIKEK